MTRHNNVSDMTIQEQLETMKDTICEDICKYTEQYRACYKDPDEADEKRIADMCHFCVVTRL